VVGALESAPAAVTVGSAAIGVADGEASAGGTIAGILRQDGVNLSFSKSGNDRPPSSGKTEDAPKERVKRTKEDVIRHFKKLNKEKKWKWKLEKGKKIYTNRETGEKRCGDFLHNEIECNEGDESWVIDPVTEKILDKAGHPFNAK
jgi:hypothetical protein